jgi:UDP-glucose 4-epimerase
VRDYIHVTDLADAHVAALRYLLNGGKTTQLNLGTGVGLSVRQIVAAVESNLGLTVPYVDAPRRMGDPPALVADPRRAMQLLDWHPVSSTREIIIESAGRWHRSRLSAGSNA